MSLNAIALFRHSGGLEFHFDGCGPFTPTDIGKRIVNALLQGTEVADHGWRPRESVTVGYLVDMLRYTGKAGEFYDDLEGGDHDFDRNTPTPGVYWDEVRDMRARAKAAAFEATDIRDSEALGFLSATYEDIAREMTDAANRYDASKLGLRPFAGSLTVPTAKLWDRKVGADAIWWDGQVFKFGGFYVSPTILARMIANTLLRGEEWVTVGDIDVTVNYLVQMCREVGKHGEFVDFTDEEFDPNVAPDMGADAA
jgi:hypothetical protein